MPASYFEPNFRRTCILSAAVTEGTFVAITGNYVGASTVSAGAQDPTVGPCAAAARAYGWAETGGVAGDPITVVRRGVVPVTTTAALTAGQAVEAGAGGLAAPNSSGVLLGIAETATASGATAPVAINL